MWDVDAMIGQSLEANHDKITAINSRPSGGSNDGRCGWPAGQPAHLEDNQEFVADCCRYAENILSEEAVQKK